MAMAQADMAPRRPGYPRSEDIPPRITLRMEPQLFAAMKAKVKELKEERGKYTQRMFIEAALKDLLKLKPNKRRPMFQDNDDVTRTGMWIDPELLTAMDARIEEEGSSQRALIEDAVRRRLRQLGP